MNGNPLTIIVDYTREIHLVIGYEFLGSGLEGLQILATFSQPCQTIFLHSMALGLTRSHDSLIQHVATFSVCCFMDIFTTLNWLSCSHC